MLKRMGGFRIKHMEYMSVILRIIVELCITFLIDLLEFSLSFHFVLLENYMLFSECDFRTIPCYFGTFRGKCITKRLWHANRGRCGESTGQ